MCFFVADDSCKCAVPAFFLAVPGGASHSFQDVGEDVQELPFGCPCKWRSVGRNKERMQFSLITRFIQALSPVISLNRLLLLGSDVCSTLNSSLLVRV